MVAWSVMWVGCQINLLSGLIDVFGDDNKAKGVSLLDVLTK